jgi:hypothetical protein
MITFISKLFSSSDQQHDRDVFALKIYACVNRKDGKLFDSKKKQRIRKQEVATQLKSEK